jgi:hypothetical protein
MSDVTSTSAPGTIAGTRAPLPGGRNALADEVTLSTELNLIKEAWRAGAGDLVPGALKNALDWASRPFPDNVLHDKPAAVVGAGTGLFGAVWAQAELRKILGASGAKVLDEELPVGHAQEAFDDGRLAAPETTERLREILSSVVAHAEQMQMAEVERRERAGSRGDGLPARPDQPSGTRGA